MPPDRPRAIDTPANAAADAAPHTRPERRPPRGSLFRRSSLDAARAHIRCSTLRTAGMLIPVPKRWGPPVTGVRVLRHLDVLEAEQLKLVA